MPPSAYSFRLQKGIIGGFAPPTPNEIHIVDKASDSVSLSIQSAVRTDGTSELQNASPKTISSEDHGALVDELHTILKEIPTEQPPGSEDIYGLDTSIGWISDDLEWYNGGPQGCGGGESYVKPTAEEKAKFKRAVEIVNELTSKEGQ